MSELMINATPSLSPNGSGNVNALNPGDASSRNVDSAATNTQSAPDSPFAAVLKSKMDKPDSAVVEDTDSSVAATEVAAGNAIGVDLSVLLPFLGANPAGTGEPASIPAAVKETGPDDGLLGELQAVTEPSSVPIPAGLPATPAAALPALQRGVLAGTKPAASTGAPPSTPAIGIETSPGKQKAEAIDHAIAAASHAMFDEPEVTPGKMAPNAAINADAGSRSGVQNATEAPAGDFHALMERAVAIAPAAASPSNGPSANLSLRIDTPLGHTGWQEETGQKLTWMVGNGRQHADLVLTPPNLGRVEISLTINGDQAGAIFTSPNPAVREALEGSLHRLREILADAGVSLGQAQVGSESPNPSPQREGSGDKAGFGDREGLRYASIVAMPGATAVARTGTGRGMVDVFA